jgi:glycosyltransferase involved in cell wall biosynthesis
MPRDTAPRVTVVLPSYNAASSLPRALDSVFAQTLADLEVIVADDGSTDGTAEVAEAFAGSDGRVRVLRGELNAGAATARNRAMAAARGEWLALLDADDTMATDRLERLVALGEARQADIVADNLRLVSEDGEVLGTALRAGDPVFTEPLTAAAFLRRNLFLTRGFKLGYLKPLFRRSFVLRQDLRQDETLRIAEDFHFLLDALLAGAHGVVDPLPGYDYLQRRGSLSRGLSLDDLRRLSAANRALLVRPPVQADAEVMRAAQRRQWSVDLNIDFVHFVAAVKRRRVLDAGAIFARHPDLTPFLAFYGLQSLRKRLPGGGGYD